METSYHNGPPPVNCFLDAALDYMSRGWSVIPIRPRDKRPLIKWELYQLERADETTIRNWWNQYPNANVGIVTGAISGIIVLDIDGPEGQESVAGKELPLTPTVTTGKGRHVYLAHLGGSIRNFARKLPGLDLRGDGGYVLAPLSIHPNGKRYEWLDGPSVPPAAPPVWLVDLLTPAATVPRQWFHGAHRAYQRCKRRVRMGKPH